MSPVDGGRHCGSCDKVIADYSKMTDQEIIRHINTSGSGCAHFRADQVSDGTTYGGWKFHHKWKVAVAMLLIGSVFLVSCRRRTTGFYAIPKKSWKHKHKKEQGRSEVREHFITEESK